MNLIEEQNHSRKKELTLLIAVLTTFVSLVPTAYVAITSNSIVLTADFLRCLVEFGAILLSWIIMKRVLRGDKSSYDYGFGKLEQIASLGVAVALGISFIVIFLLSLHRIFEPVEVDNFLAGMILGFLSVAGNIVMWFYYEFLASRDGSPIIKSQSRLFRAKTYASSVVVGSLLLNLIDSSSNIVQYADPIGSIILSGFLLHNAIRLMSSSMNDLLDRSIEEALRLAVLKVLLNHNKNYHGLRSIRSRQSGGKIYIEINLEFLPTLNFGEVSNLIQQIRKDTIEAVPKSDIIVVPFLPQQLD